MSLAQLKDYLVEKYKDEDRDKNKASKSSCEQFENEVFKWKPLKR